MPEVDEFNAVVALTCPGADKPEAIVTTNGQVYRHGAASEWPNRAIGCLPGDTAQA